MRLFHHILAVIAILCLAAPPRAGAQGLDADAEHDTFLRHVRFLSQFPHRLAGSEADRKVREYITRELEAAGVNRIVVQPIEVTRPSMVAGECYAEAGGRRYPLYPMRPNLVQAAITPAGGLTGRPVYLGKEAARQGNVGTDLEGRIAVLDYDCGHHWKTAFERGAEAVIFVGRLDGLDRAVAKHYEAPANLPRFYMTAEDAEQAGLFSPAPPEIRLQASASWAPLRSANIVALIEPGADVDEKEKDESAIILASEFDSYGDVPDLAPNYRKAVNTAALLAFARRAASLPTRRKLLLCFFTDGAGCHNGARQFYYSVLKKREKKSGHDSALDAKIAFFQEERERLQETLVFVAGSTDILRDDFQHRDTLIRDFKRELQYRIAAIRENAIYLSQDIRRNVYPEGAEKDAARERLAGINQTIREWNELNRDIKNRRLRDMNAPHYREILARVVAVMERRVGELDFQIESLERGAELGAFLIDGDKQTTVIAHISLDLSEKGQNWGFSIFGMLGPYKTILKGITAATETLAEDGRELPLFEKATVEGSIKPSYFYPNTGSMDEPEVSSDLCIAAGAFAFTARTLNTTDPLYGSPFETLDAYSLERFDAQRSEVTDLISELILEPDFSAQQPTPNCDHIMDLDRTVTSDYSGPLVSFQQVGSALADYPCRGAVVALDRYGMNLMAPDYHRPHLLRAMYYRTDANGHYTCGPMRREFWWYRKTIGLPDDRGRVQGLQDNSGGWTNTDVVFQGNGGYAFDLFSFHNQGFGGYIGPGSVNLTKAIGNVGFRKFHVSLDRDVFTFYVWGKEDTKLYSINSFMLLNLSGEGLADERYGTGFPIKDDSWQPVSLEDQSARDLSLLNEHRLQILRRKNIVNESLEALHGRTSDFLREGKGMAAMISEWRVYSPLKRSIDDIVKAAVILLLLIVPFAFVLERLLIGANLIYKQILGFAVFFMLTFALLYSVHPAFDIAGTPIIIFLAFVIIITSGYVIFVIMQRFKTEVMRMQGLETSLHQADVSRFNTLLAAVALGISTMRRRPLRTALTSVTIILLTFTILCFSSFTSEIGVAKAYKGQLCPDKSMLLHTKDWSVVNPRLMEIVRSLADDSVQVFGRYWLSSSLWDIAHDSEPLKIVLATEGMTAHTTIDAVMGLDPRELGLKQGLDECLVGDPSLLESDGVFLASSVLERLGLEVGDPVCIKGYRLRVAGYIDSRRMMDITQVDGSPLLPVDYSSIKNIMTSQDDIWSVIQSMDSTQFTSVPVEMVAITSGRMVRRLDGNLRSIVAYPRGDLDLEQLAEDAAIVFPDYVYVGLDDGVYAAYFTNELSFTGIGDIVAPLLLGGLIIFMTMLASVADREREIYSFSALGLAPPHVASLFFAEAAVYSVVGGLGGYLFSQVVVKALTWLSEFGWVRVPELNPSSLTAIVTILIVMAVTLVSTIYPAIKASRSANPGIQRAWRMPPAQGDLLEVTFPFTVSEYDLTGIVAFLAEHFVNFGDSTLGTFSAQDVEIFEDPERRAPALRAGIWLAPFDLGISERFTMTSGPSGIEGVAEVRIRITRTSGSPGSWYRSNKTFLEDLRRQFLIWRTVDQTHAETYRNHTLQLLSGAATPTVNPDS